MPIQNTFHIKNYWKEHTFNRAPSEILHLIKYTNFFCWSFDQATDCAFASSDGLQYELYRCKMYYFILS
jgi:hypothetical protein